MTEIIGDLRSIEMSSEEKKARVPDENCKIPQEDELMVDGGGWNEFGKAFLGTVLIAGGVVGAGIGGLVKNEAI